MKDRLKVELQLGAEFDVSELTKGWTDDEFDALVRGDEGAGEALSDEAFRRMYASPGEFVVEEWATYQ